VSDDQFIQLARPETSAEGYAGTVRLTFAQREKARQRVQLTDGTQIAINLQRGQIMRGGEDLVSASGRRVRIEAATETVTTATCADALHLARIAYHLGNRHVSLQLGPGWVRYLQDRVLDEMVRGLGAVVEVHTAPFEPEAGAYGGHHHH